MEENIEETKKSISCCSILSDIISILLVLTEIILIFTSYTNSLPPFILLLRDIVGYTLVLPIMLMMYFKLYHKLLNLTETISYDKIQTESEETLQVQQEEEEQAEQSKIENQTGNLKHIIFC